MRHLRFATTVLGLLTALFVSLLSPVAQAAPAGPTGLTPDGGSVASNPVLSWTAVPKATSYRVELSRSATFDTLAWQVTTVNRQATPTTTLPSGDLFWRVRAVDSSGASGPWTNASFSHIAKAAPAQLSPGDGDSLPQPAEPPQLVWAPVNGAASYELAVGTDPNLSTATSYTTKTTSYAFTTPQSQATYYWKVRAVFGGGQATEWSTVHSYDVESLAQPMLASPANSADTVLQDVVLRWHSVPGAARYEVRVSTDQNFTSVVAQATSVATQWSPAETLNNDQYWWQVRAYDSQNQTKDWAELTQTWQFERRWQFGDTTTLDPERPVLLYPANDVAPVTADPLFFEWEPVRLASQYTLQVGTDRNFSPRTFVTCSTKQTTFTPAEGLFTSGNRDCRTASGGTYYWRVQAVDETSGVVTPWSDIHTFTYRPGAVQPTSPADGASVAVPTMQWSLALGAERYKLTYSYGTTVKTITTYSTSYTPTTRIPTTSGPVTWFVQAVYANGDTSARPLGNNRSFTLGAAPTNASSPNALTADTAGDRFPSLSWQPVSGADYYRVFVGTAGTGIFQQLPDKFGYSAGTDLTKAQLSSKTYDWFVQAYDTNDVKIATGSKGSYSILELDAVAGHGVAHTGLELDSPRRCSLTLSEGTTNDVCKTRQTSVLDWDPVDGASSYQVYIARDESLTNRIYDGVSTDLTRWTPTELLPDSQAGQAYYWVVRACKVEGVCAADPIRATHAFDKTSHQVQTTAPANLAEVKDAVTFSWTDYLATNTDQLAGARSRVEARQYKVEVSTSQTFQTLLDTATVDQTTYTAPGKIYPEGPLFWRVSALDGSGNTVGTSDPQSATKQSDPVLLLSPDNNSTSPGTPALRWKPRPFTASYDIEIYKDNDLAYSTANRVLSVNSRLTAYSLTTPLPAAPLPYVWRVRSKDVSGNPGPWSEPRTFTVKGTAPAQLAPAAGIRVGATTGLFSWQAVAGANSYRFERRAVGGTTASETVNTVGLAWAPTSKLADNEWEWRVSTVDAAGKVVATSAWRAFTVDGTAPTVTAIKPSTSAGPGTDVVATFSEPVKGVTTGTMRLFLKGNDHPVSATVTMSDDSLKARLNPAKNLLVGRNYRAVLTNDITDKAGNPLVKRAWEFAVTR